MRGARFASCGAKLVSQHSCCCCSPATSLSPRTSAWRRIGIALLLAAGSICPAAVARGQQVVQQGCEIEEVQRLLGQQPRPAATVERLLLACIASGSTDYRTYMFLGVMARDAGDRERAIDYLKKAHQLDPAASNPA